MRRAPAVRKARSNGQVITLERPRQIRIYVEQEDGLTLVLFETSIRLLIVAQAPFSSPLQRLASSKNDGAGSMNGIGGVTKVKM